MAVCPKCKGNNVRLVKAHGLAHNGIHVASHLNKRGHPLIGAVVLLGSWISSAFEKGMHYKCQDCHHVF